MCGSEPPMVIRVRATVWAACVTMVSAPVSAKPDADRCGPRGRRCEAGEGHGPCLFLCVFARGSWRVCWRDPNRPELIGYVSPNIRIMMTHQIEERPMIQDRLTAKFQSAKPAKRRETKAQATPKAKSGNPPATNTYTRGRLLSGSFWL